MTPLARRFFRRIIGVRQSCVQRSDTVRRFAGAVELLENYEIKAYPMNSINIPCYIFSSFPFALLGLATMAETGTLVQVCARPRSAYDSFSPSLHLSLNQKRNVP